ncbi:trypco2 family protein [Streptomyces prasinus]|uniref:trypco2 family protein n=1 Tax=Streptomyces prasinus TaxID=67345 RepID=UPI0033310352
MVTTALYEIDTSEADNDTTVPAEGTGRSSHRCTGTSRDVERGPASHPPDTHPDAPIPPKPGRPAPKPWQTTPQAQCALGVRMAGIGLTAAIEELRQELYRAQGLGADQQFTFGIEEAELELQLELRNSGKGDGKVSFGVATVGAGGELSTVRTHRLTLKLSVRDRARGGSSPEISDTETGSWDEE